LKEYGAKILNLSSYSKLIYICPRQTISSSYIRKDAARNKKGGKFINEG